MYIYMYIIEIYVYIYHIYIYMYIIYIYIHYMYIDIYMYMHIIHTCKCVRWFIQFDQYSYTYIYLILPSYHHIDLNIFCVQTSTHMHTREIRSEGVTWLTHMWHCNTLQHTATHYKTLHHTTTHCNTLQLTATHYNSLQHTATHRGDEKRRRDPCYSVVRCEYVESSV